MNERRVNGSISETSQNFFNDIMEKLRISQNLIVQCAVVSGISFLAGFLLKKFSSYVAVIVAIGLVLILLSHFGVVNIMFDWSKAQSFLGIDLSTLSDGNVIEKIGELVRANIIATVFAFVGFIIGLRLG